MPKVNEQLLKTERILSSLLSEINDIKAKSNFVFHKEYEDKIRELEGITRHLSYSLEQYKKRYNRYHDISLRLAEKLKDQDRLLHENKIYEKEELKNKVIDQEKKILELVQRYDLMRKELHKRKRVDEQKILEELKAIHQKSKYYQKKYEYYFDASEKLSRELKKREKELQDNSTKKELALTRKKLKEILTNIEVTDTIRKKELASRYDRELSSLTKELERNKILAESNKRKYEKYYKISRQLMTKEKETDSSNIKLKKIVKQMDKKLTAQSFYYATKIESIKKDKKKALENITKEHLKRELEQNTEINRLKRDVKKYFELYKKTKIQKAEAFEKAKKFFE